MVRKPVEITTLHAAHVDASMPTIPLKAYPGLGTSALGRLPRMHLATGAHAMFYATAALAIVAGPFYSARLHELVASAPRFADMDPCSAKSRLTCSSLQCWPQHGVPLCAHGHHQEARPCSRDRVEGRSGRQAAALSTPCARYVIRLDALPLTVKVDRARLRPSYCSNEPERE
jgi:hypothetical protein